MKRSFLSFLVIGVLFINTNCKNNNGELNYEEPCFPQVINLETKNLNDSFLFSSGDVEVVDSLIICSGMVDVSEKAFHLFSKNSGRYITSSGNIGRSRGEISQPWRSFTVDKQQRTIYVFDSPQQKVVSYSLDKVIAGKIDYSKEISLPCLVNNISSHHFKYLRNSFLVGYTLYDRFLVCSETDSITSSNFFPKLHEPEGYLQVEHQYYFYLGCMAVKPDGNMFVHATRGGCVFEIWNNDGTTISPKIIKGFFKPNYNSSYREYKYPMVMANEDDHFGIGALYCTNDYIYANYYNNSSEMPNQIAVFDWKGLPQKMYVTDRSIISFAVEEQKVYALALNDETKNIELISFSL